MNYMNVNQDFNIIQLIKALQCSLYQCSEPPVYGTEQYNQWNKFTSNLALVYVQCLPEYDTAKWELQK